MSLSYNYPPQMAYPSAPPVYRALPAPPRLHWGWVLALSIVSIGIFGIIWVAVQSYWVKKATKNGKPFAWALAYVIFLPFVVVMAGTVGALSTMGKLGDSAANLNILVDLFTRLGGFVLYLASAYTLKGALEAEPIDIPLSGVMTFFFASTYFQYHLYDYNVEGRVGEQLSGFGKPAVAGAPAGVVNAPEVPPQA
ncbi:MAG TPA: hypothetical protein VGU25_03895 [Acidobacteriaceae bacterium]|nr:hypothetical protein [Acidobacteriaceae bacterium]